MEEIAAKLSAYILNLSDFKYLEMSSANNYETGDTLSFSVDDSRNLTFNNMGATIIDVILQSGVKYDSVV